ncbi:hypothetical protein [Variovorax sp. Sphag1AA]|uniref:hypothetical protein n=1 Tax=Variovorax sp. Sphag1AA TaxID=2587027 RepID=UPI0017ABC3CF|nr:hypothetical protein [Variovorax sp. Sphag1AA]MBB3179238.1 starvation-inducible outer membrane lipoprotein [Variovorax sp. Sphag1AA]
MSFTRLLVPRARLAAALLGCITPFAAIQAQNPPPAESSARPAQEQSAEDKAAGRQNQKIERIHIEDSRNKIDELRVGGQTQNITVQPKTTNTPAYQVMPNGERSRNEGQSESSASDSGSRVWWNVFKF